MICPRKRRISALIRWSQLAFSCVTISATADLRITSRHLEHCERLNFARKYTHRRSGTAPLAPVAITLGGPSLDEHSHSSAELPTVTLVLLSPQLTYIYIVHNELVAFLRLRCRCQSPITRTATIVDTITTTTNTFASCASTSLNIDIQSFTLYTTRSRLLRCPSTPRASLFRNQFPHI